MPIFAGQRFQAVRAKTESVAAKLEADLAQLDTAAALHALDEIRKQIESTNLKKVGDITGAGRSGPRLPEVNVTWKKER